MTRGTFELSGGFLLSIFTTTKDTGEFVMSAAISPRGRQGAWRAEVFVAPTQREAWAAVAAWVEGRIS